MTDPTTRLNAALEGRYRIEREIGEGGMATVYLAEDERHNRNVALKVLKPELAAVVGAERFLSEIETTAQLTHPHILPLFDSGEADGFLFFVTPFIEGDTLRDKIDRQKQLSVEEALKITEDVASALDYAHENGVVHRDIKPGNILLSAKGEPTVADFGIALAVAQAGGGRVTETGLSVGTPHYMSPEQATGDRDVDPRTDVYALGCILYEMLTGDPPYGGSTAQAVLAKILTDPAPTPNKIRVAIPPNVDSAIRKALEKLPADRFGSADEFARALGDPGFRHGEETEPGVVASTGIWKPWALAATAVAVMAIGWSSLRRVPAEVPRPVTRVSVRIPEDQFFNSVSGDFDLAPDGSRMVYRGVGDEGQAQLWARWWDALDATPIPDTDRAARPAISPDGQEVAFTFSPTGGGQEAGSLRVVPLQGGVSPTIASNARSPRWSPDGAWIYYTDSSGGLSRAPSGGGTVEIVTAVDAATGERSHSSVDVLPGNRVVYQVGGVSQLRPPVIQAVDLRTGEVTDVTAGRYPRYVSAGYLLFLDAIESTLLVAPFDAERLALTGPARPVAVGLFSVAGSGSRSFAVSQTGTLAYRRGNAAGIALSPTWVERNGTAREIQPGWRVLGALNRSSLALSPDGTRLALSILDLDGRYDIWTKQLDTGPLSRVTVTGEENIRATWSRDGESLTYVAFGEGSDRDVWTKRADGSGSASLVLDRERPIWNALYSSDGNWLIFREGANQAADIYALRLPMDSVAVPLEVTEFQERYIALSPDDRWLAYVSNRSGRDEVYVRPFPDAGSALVQVSTNGGVEPVWAHSGRELFYRNAANELVAVQVTSDPTFAPGQQEVLFSTDDYLTSNGRAQYDVSPDDQRFVMLRIEEQARDEFILVQNFFEELRQVVPDN